MSLIEGRIERGPTTRGRPPRTSIRSEKAGTLHDAYPITRSPAFFSSLLVPVCLNHATSLPGAVGAQNTRASVSGHHRSWTRPMMYFSGTCPQCRLSELLFRWSPITK